MFLQVDARHLNIWVHTQHFNNITTSALTRSSYAPVPFRRLPLSCLPVHVCLLPLSSCVWCIHAYINVFRKYVSVNILYFWQYTTSVQHDIYIFESILHSWKYTTFFQHDIFCAILEYSLIVALWLPLPLYIIFLKIYNICTAWHIPTYTRMLSHCGCVALSHTFFLSVSSLSEALVLSPSLSLAVFVSVSISLSLSRSLCLALSLSHYCPTLDVVE
jgi:hypothetical protein